MSGLCFRKETFQFHHDRLSYTEYYNTRHGEPRVGLEYLGYKEKYLFLYIVHSTHYFVENMPLMNGNTL